MPTVYEYEVQMRVTNKNTRADKIVKRKEWAYSVMDAVMQASMHINSDPETGSADMTLISVGPPEELRVAALEESKKLVESIMTRLKKV